jgi:hypothetical protein
MLSASCQVGCRPVLFSKRIIAWIQATAGMAVVVVPYGMI